MKTKMKSLLILIAICGSFAMGSVEQAAPKEGEVWAGISYLAARRGASAEAGLAINAIGLIDAAAWGFGVGMVAGPAGGMIAGATAGM
ncbi:MULTISPECIES: hypothetical protein [unclassified Cyclobacterium]|jgi:hypothetical protein|uniref:hypothetical protein n=1 Tax=unclassified Cyclobacterium TaxID=2615055 RepID=UPI0013D4D594|nr:MULTISPECIES: hypothetical protein [unclassified Cyclobacterium]MBD3630948.1 hypothetical protein [Cyclobacterium sp.]